MVTLRHVQPDDLSALYAISLATGHAGTDASHLYADPELIGHIYSAPYACLEPSLALVALDDNGVAGFAIGVLDTAAWEDTLARDWWPALRQRYPDPGETESATWTADQRRAAMIHRPERVPPAIARDYPAHLHLNLSPRAQGRGVGPRLLDAWLALAGGRGARDVHVGVNRSNIKAARFWERHGFRPLAIDVATNRTLWMGRTVAPP
ncbi:GNAT family N-acetyltransferase [soil metagenome]